MDIVMKVVTITFFSGQGQSIVSGWICVSPVTSVYRRENTDAQFQFGVSGNLPQQAGEVKTFDIAYYDGTSLGRVRYVFPGSVTTDQVAGVTVSADASGKIVMTLEDVKLNNKGTYRIFGITGTLGCTCLYILGLPTKPTIYVNNSPSLGGSTTLACRSSSTTTPSNHSLSLTYSWKVDNVENPTHSKYSYSTNRNTLTLSNLVKEDARKQFTCLATEVVSDGYNSGRSDLLTIDVRYPPDGPPVITNYTDGGDYRVLEGTQGQLSCSVSGGNPAPTLTWNCINSGISLTTSSGTVTRTHSWLATRGQDKTCICRASHYSGDQSVSIRINILYPPTKPTYKINSTSVSGTVKVIRHNSLSVTCSSEGQPAPSYKWTFQNGATINGAQLILSSVQTNGRYTCDVQNTMNPSVGAFVSGSNSSFIQVHILYPPSLPTFKYWNTSGDNIPARSLDVIKGDTFKVACVSTGVPAPTYHWNNLGANQILTVNSITADQSRICTARNTMAETVGQTLLRSATATLKINVLYPPSFVTMKYHYGGSSVVSLTTTLSIIEGNPFTVTCSSNSKPAPSYKWTGNVTSLSATVQVDNTRRPLAGTLTCIVENTMTRSFANPEKERTGSTSGGFSLQVLYPPVIDDLKNMSVVEGSPSTVSCPVTVGNPRETTFEWRRSGQIWKRTPQFTIDTTSRTDAMFYTCTVSNKMTQTGNQPISQPDTKSFYLNVWYSAVVTEFFIVGHKGETSVTLNETETVEFQCNADSNPGPILSIIYQEHVKHSQTNIKSVAYSIVSAACTDNGIYSCVGFNNYNVNNSTKSLNLFINCSPRPSPFVTLNENVTSALHKSALLTFTTLAYPEPEDTDFRWYRWYTSDWLPVVGSGQFQVTTSSLQTNLTINDVNHTTFGRYKLEVRNAIGRYEQIFRISPQDVPEQPKHFRHMSELVTKSSVTVQWSPGSDNGPDQTFVLGYKKVSDSEWVTFYVPDSGKSKMNYTISGLSSGTEYHVVLYAYNLLGISTETEVLTIKTKDSPTTCASARNSNTPIMIALGVVCGAFAVYAVSVSILYKRKVIRTGTQSPQQSTEQRTYVNVAFKPEITENQYLQDLQGKSSNVDADGHRGDTVAQYSSLDQYSRDDRTTYDVLQ